MLQRTSGAIMFVVKISKFCNLRCSYCYEFEELGQRRRMSLADLHAFFTNVRDAVGCTTAIVFSSSGTVASLS